jgi:hypothetical protein
MRYITVMMLLLLVMTTAHTQRNILDSEEIQKKVERCLYATYGFHFSEAKAIQVSLENEMSSHPAPFFLKALIIYWENFPILPEDPAVLVFEAGINRAIELAGNMMNKDPDSMEGLFFDLHSRAFKAMFWADNGKPGKVIPDLNAMYYSTLRGFDYKDIFNEFYFSSGMYNYYIEAYTEKHPIYKPLALFFRRGDKQLGLKEIEYAIHNTTYIKHEARLFMSLIQLNYEKDINEALEHAAKLYNYFPKNIYYLGQYLIILVHNRQYSVAAALNAKLSDETDDFHRLIYLLIEGFLNENHRNSPLQARNHYKQVLREAERLGAIANLYAAIASAGLARIAEKEGDTLTARKQRKQSSRQSNYEFILEFR